jgi:hypothetical protein
LNELVPVKKGELVVYKERPYKIVNETTVFATKDEIKKHLPTICGNVLAKAWIDTDFEDKLIVDIHKTFREGGVILPEEFKLEYVKPSGQRAKISIYEQRPGSKFKLRVCSLTLTMMAQR